VFRATAKLPLQDGSTGSAEEYAALHSRAAPMQYASMQWDDLRYVLAVTRTGSASKAARSLGVDQTTVLRKLDLLETTLGTSLFERRKTGQTPTPAGKLVAEAAERMEKEAHALENALATRRRVVGGAVRLTTSDGLAGRFVTPCMRSFQALYPGVTVELIATDERLDIAGGEADVALRGSSHPEGAGIVARRMPDILWTIYCSPAYAAERGIPDCRDALHGHDIVGFEGRLTRLPGWRWLSEAVPDAVVRFRSSSFVSMVANLRAGLGVGPLPTIIGDAEQGLVRCFPPPPELRDELWLIVREELKNEPHVRALTDFLASYVRETFARAT
jgi:DNA-binding transcriptional LysR family regulator